MGVMANATGVQRAAEGVNLWLLRCGWWALGERAGTGLARVTITFGYGKGAGGAGWYCVLRRVRTVQNAPSKTL
jgi:hypothetical protein